MKLNKHYKLKLLILLCLAIILILIYLKYKKIDLFSININPYSIHKYLREQELENELQSKMKEQDLKIKHLTDDTQIVLNGGIMPITTTTMATTTQPTTRQPTTTQPTTTQPTTTQPTTTKYIPPLRTVPDAEDITDLLKSSLTSKVASSEDSFKLSQKIVAALAEKFSFK